MKILLVLSIKDKMARFIGKGDTVDLFSLLTIASFSISERIMKEKNISMEDAMSFVLEGTREAMNLHNENYKKGEQ